MELVKSSASKWVIGDWVTVADVSGTGTTETGSDNIYVQIPDVDMCDWMLEVERTVQRTSGTGIPKSYVQLYQYQGDGTATAKADAPYFFTGYVAGDDNGILNRLRLKPGVLQSYSVQLTSRLCLKVYGIGTAADTEYSITGIRARLCYLPM